MNLQTTIEKRHLPVIAQYLHTIYKGMKNESISDKTDRYNMRTLIEKLLEKVRKHQFKKQGHKVKMSVSINEYDALDRNINLEAMTANMITPLEAVIFREFMQPMFNQLNVQLP